jgi:hypothetical protein
MFSNQPQSDVSYCALQQFHNLGGFDGIFLLKILVNLGMKLENVLKKANFATANTQIYPRPTSYDMATARVTVPQHMSFQRETKHYTQTPRPAPVPILCS